MQSAGRVLLVSPVYFGLNPETVSDNVYQKKDEKPGEEESVRKEAMRERSDRRRNCDRQRFEWRCVRNILKDTPDACFLNNVFSTQLVKGKKHVIYYPMKAPNRRKERDSSDIRANSSALPIPITNPTSQISLISKRTIHFSKGLAAYVWIGSIVVAYVALSERSHLPGRSKNWAKTFGILFDFLLYQRLNTSKPACLSHQCRHECRNTLCDRLPRSICRSFGMEYS